MDSLNRKVMSEHVDNIKENKAQSQETAGLDMEMVGGSSLSFQDNRPEAMQRKSQQAAANEDPQVKQLQAAEAALNKSPRTQGKMPMFAENKSMVQQKGNEEGGVEQEVNIFDLKSTKGFIDAFKAKENSHRNTSTLDKLQLKMRVELDKITKELRLKAPNGRSEEESTRLNTQLETLNKGITYIEKTIRHLRDLSAKEVSPTGPQSTTTLRDAPKPEAKTAQNVRTASFAELNGVNIYLLESVKGFVDAFKAKENSYLDPSSLDKLHLEMTAERDKIAKEEGYKFVYGKPRSEEESTRLKTQLETLNKGVTYVWEAYSHLRALNAKQIIPIGPQNTAKQA
jgi:hypothetical protein